MIELFRIDGDLFAEFQRTGIGRDRLILSIDRERGIPCQSPIGHSLSGIACLVIMAGQLQGKWIAMLSRYGFQGPGNFPMQHSPFSHAEFIIQILLG